LRTAVHGTVAAVGCAVREAARGRRRGFAEDEELDEGANEQDDGELP